MVSLWCWIIPILCFSHAWALSFLQLPSSVSVGASFTLAWRDPPSGQFEVGITPGLDTDASGFQAVNPNGKSSGSVVLVAPSTPGEFHLVARSLPDHSLLGTSATIQALARGDNVTDTNDLSSTIQTQVSTAGLQQQTKPQQTAFQSSAATATQPTLISTAQPSAQPAPTSAIQLPAQSTPASATHSSAQPTSTSATHPSAQPTSTSATQPTVPQPTGFQSDSGPSTEVAKIVGGVSAAVVSLILLVLCWFYRHRRVARQRGEDAGRQIIDAFPLRTDIPYSAGDSQAAVSIHDTTTSTSEYLTTDAFSNRNVRIPVSRQYRSGSFFKKIRKGRRDVNSMTRNEIAPSDLSNHLRNEMLFSESRLPQRTPNILRHLDSGLRIFQARAESADGRPCLQESMVGKEGDEHGSESGDNRERVIELPPEYSVD